MSNEYVNASAQFLKESWYRENAGTPEAQQSKLLDEIFEQIVDYCLNCGIEIDESVEIANEIIEEGLVEEFYEEFLIENPEGMSSASRMGTSERERIARQRMDQARTQRIANQVQVRKALESGKGINTPRDASIFGGNRPAVPSRPNQRGYGVTLPSGRQGVQITGGAAGQAPGRGSISNFSRASNTINVAGQTLYKAQRGNDIVYLQRQGAGRLFNQPKPTPTGGTGGSNRPTATTTTPTGGTGGSNRPTATTTTPTGGTGGSRTGSTPTAPRTTPTAPTARASTLSSRSNATASVRPIVPTAPARATEPTAPPVTRPTMARLGQGEKDSIFNREGGRQEYERRMRQAIRSGTRYQPAASTGTPAMNAPRTLGGGTSA